MFMLYSHHIEPVGYEALVFEYTYSPSICVRRLSRTIFLPQSRNTEEIVKTKLPFVVNMFYHLLKVDATF